MGPQNLNILAFMSGSSLDGMDIGVISVSCVNGNYAYRIIQAETIPYNSFWAKALKTMPQVSSENLVKFDFDYARYCAETINDFCQKHNVSYDLISYHGHTIFHNPAEGYTFSLGNLSALSALTSKQVIGDFRDMDVALDGQGAPLMGIADILLFNQYKINLNLGGICNISVNGVEKIAFDICPCNQLYNFIYNNIGIAYDDKGELAKTGSLHVDLLNSLNAHPYYNLPYPKSLDNNLIFRQILPKLDIALADIDKLHTITEFVTSHITMCIETLLVKKVISQGDKLLITGGGTHNLYLVQQLKKKLMKYNITCAETSDDIINYKEIVLMALLAFLKKYDKVNVLSNFTGALKDTKSGGVYG